MLPLQQNHMLFLQVSKQIMDSKFPVNKELALELAALMAQVVLGGIWIHWDSDPLGTEVFLLIPSVLNITIFKLKYVAKIHTFFFLGLGRL